MLNNYKIPITNETILKHLSNEENNSLTKPTMLPLMDLASCPVIFAHVTILDVWVKRLSISRLFDRSVLNRQYLLECIPGALAEVYFTPGLRLNLGVLGCRTKF